MWGDINMPNYRIKLLSVAIVVVFCVLSCGLASKYFVPKVAYLSPKSEGEITIKAGESIMFSWKTSPRPGSGRDSFRFVLRKGFEGENIVAETLPPTVYSYTVLGDKFENGSTYSWFVKQRDMRTQSWSLADTWVFKVYKK